MPSQDRPARDRLLAAADHLFYSRGIRNVPVDDVIREAGVTRATFYRNFPAKEDLVRLYLTERADAIRARAEAAAATVEKPAEMMQALIDGIMLEICVPGFRGCPFINAAAEYPDSGSPIHEIVSQYRTWFRDLLVRLARQLDIADPEFVADTLVLLRDGAMVGGYLDNPDEIRLRLHQATEQLLQAQALLNQSKA